MYFGHIYTYRYVYFGHIYTCKFVYLWHLYSYERMYLRYLYTASVFQVHLYMQMCNSGTSTLQVCVLQVHLHLQVCILCVKTYLENVLGLLLYHPGQNNLWHIFQSAFRPKRNTETALLRVFSDPIASDSGSVSILSLLDLSAAFDTIDHNILLTRPENTFGICDLALSLFCP